MSAPFGRRGFLRGLVSLPLVGGGVTLVGDPVAAAEPVTAALLDRYVAFLAHEHREALIETQARVNAGMTMAQRCLYAPMFWYPDDPVAIQAATATPPSARAAIVLAAIGCGWPRAPVA